jgi:hypothetical protein
MKWLVTLGVCLDCHKKLINSCVRALEPSFLPSLSGNVEFSRYGSVGIWGSFVLQLPRHCLTRLTDQISSAGLKCM